MTDPLRFDVLSGPYAGRTGTLIYESGYACVLRPDHGTDDGDDDFGCMKDQVRPARPPRPADVSAETGHHSADAGNMVGVRPVIPAAEAGR